MVQSCLIEIDDPNFQPTSSDTYYSVPGYVWERMAGAKFQSGYVPSEPPWLFPKSKWSDTDALSD
jgi:hypothetical protein